MTNGLCVELDELISLRHYAQKLNNRSKSHSNLSGDRHSRARGRGMDFAEVRNYQAGDEIRHMEWRVTARTGRPHIKLYQEERERPVVILCDFNPSMYFGTRLAFKSVIAARLAGLICWITLLQEDKVAGLLFNAQEHHEFMPRSRAAGILPLLAAISYYTKLKIKNGWQCRKLSDALLRLRRIVKPGSRIILISDFYQMDDLSNEHLSYLRAHNDLIAYHICDPLELAPPKPGKYGITNGRVEMLLDTTNKAVYEAYQVYCSQRIMDLKTRFSFLHSPYVSVTPTADLAKLIKQTFLRKSYG